MYRLMRTLTWYAAMAALSGVLLLGLAGCSESSGKVDPAVVAQHRAMLELSEEPTGGMTVVDVREALLGPTDHANHDDHEGHDHDAGHDDHEGHDHDAQEHADHSDHDHAVADHDAHDHDAGHDDTAGHDHDAQEHADHSDHDSAHDSHEDLDHADHDHADHADESAEDHADHDHETHAHDADAHGDHDHAAHTAHSASAGPLEVVLIGQVGGLANPWKETQPEFPFVKNEAKLFLADPGDVSEVEASGHAHAPGEECAFCEAHAADSSASLAVVQFNDEQGQVLPVDVRQLFDLKGKETVVICGTARIEEGGLLVVDATGLYIRR